MWVAPNDSGVLENVDVLSALSFEIVESKAHTVSNMQSLVGFSVIPG